MPLGSLTKSCRSSTTQKYKGWDAVSEEYKRFFLPIFPTASNGRPVLDLGVDFDRRFEGKSLLYLCIEVDILASVLKTERCMGYLEPSAVEMILQERKLVREAERAVGGERGQVNKNGSQKRWERRHVLEKLSRY